MQPRQLNQAVVVVIGSGAAGLSAAIEAAGAGVRAVVLTKEVYRYDTFRWVSRGGCTWKTNAFNAAVGEGDSVAAHVAETLAGGAHAGNPGLVQTLCEGALELIDWLERLGLRFERDAEGGLATRPYGGNELPRAVYLEDNLGFHVQRVLLREANRLIGEGRLSLATGLRAHELLTSDAGEIMGLRLLDAETLELWDVAASAVVLADGGGASMYAPTAVSADKTCDGLSLGLRTGAEAIDLEFVQFHPTGLTSEVVAFDGALIGENIRFQGGVLRNREERRFMFDYHPKGETATRDIVARGIYTEIAEGRGFENGAVALDIDECRDFIIRHCPVLFERLRQAGTDPRIHTRIFVRPTAHFLMGGLRIDPRARSTVPGLLVAGESAGGVHGANRIGGNGLSEAMVFGRIAGRTAAERALGRSGGNGAGKLVPASSLRVRGGGSENPDALLHELRRSMYRHAGLVRSRSSLDRMEEVLDELEARADDLDFGSGARSAALVQAGLDLRNLLTAARLIVRASAQRSESRGAYCSSDYPETLPTYVGNAVRMGADGRWVWSTYSYPRNDVAKGD